EKLDRENFCGEVERHDSFIVDQRYQRLCLWRYGYEPHVLICNESELLHWFEIYRWKRDSYSQLGRFSQMRLTGPLNDNVRIKARPGMHQRSLIWSHAPSKNRDR